jgi:hypothetical protein
LTQKEFESKWIALIEKEMIKKFPDEFIDLSDCEIVIMPGTFLMIGSEFFGNYEIVDTSGQAHFNFDNYFKVKYILYSNRNKPAQILRPLKEEKIVSAVKEYERLMDSIVRDIGKDYKKVFQDSQQFPKVSNHIFTALNLQRY